MKLVYAPGELGTHTRVLLSYIIYVMTQEKNNNCIITCTAPATAGRSRLAIFA